MESWAPILVVFWLAGGQSQEGIFEFANVCNSFRLMHETGDLWVEPPGGKRQRPIDVECRCLWLEEEIPGEAS